MDYQINNGVLVSTTGSEQEITIPDNVEKVGWNSFKKRASLRKVVFPPNVKCIELTAFVDCKNLVEIDIQGVDVILEGRCFSRCKSLTKVNISGSLKQIGQGCFEECPNLVSFSIPDGLEGIGDHAFYKCEQLETMTIPEGTKSIGEWAFYGCNKLKSVHLPTTLKAVGEKAFNQTGLEEVHIKDLSAWCKVDFKYPAIEDTNMMFEKAKKLFLNGELITDVVIPKGIEEIKRGPFSGFRNIKTMNITEGVTTIKKCAFSRWDNQFDKIYFPASLKSIENDAMSWCKVKEIHIADIRSWCEMKKGNLVFDGSPEYYYRNEKLTELVIPQGTRIIGSSLFAGIKTITSVRFPEGLETIEKYAFSGCENLSILYFPSTMQHVGECAFFRCPSIKEVHIPSRKAWSLISFGPKPIWGDGDDGNPLNNGAQLIIDNASEEVEESPTVVTIDREIASLSGQAEIEEIILSPQVKKIDGEAFRDCTKLRKITIPKSVSHIGWHPFVGCPALEEIHIEDLNSWLMTPVDNTYTTLYRPQTKLFLNGELITELTIPKELKSFKMNFRGYSYLTKVIFQDGNVDVPMYSFKDCPNLTEVYLSKTIESVDSYAFNNCPKLTKVMIPNGIRNIYSNAFAGSGLTEVTLPETLIRVVDQAFAKCPKLTSIKIKSYLANVEHDGLFPGTGVFAGCHALKDISFDERVKIIWERMFENCFKLPENTRSLFDDDDLDELFGNSDEDDDTDTQSVEEVDNTIEPLRYYSIPDHITEIRHAAFSGCDALEEVSVPGSISSMEADAFGDNLQERILKGFIVHIRGKVGYGLNEFIKKNKGYKNFFFTDMLCREIPEADQKSAAVRIAKWVTMGRTVPSEVYESYVTYLKQSKANWLKKNALIDDNYPVYCILIKEKIINAAETEKLIKLTNENQMHELQVLLMNYQNELSAPGGYDSLFDDTVSSNGTVKNEEELDWLVDSTGTLVVAFEKTSATVRFPERINNKKIIGISNGFVFSSGGRSASKKVKSIILPEGYAIIGEDAFKDCSGLQTISLPDSIEQIGSGAFSGCGKLESMTIPNNLVSIAKNAFSGCDGLGNVYVSSIEKWMQLQFENESANPLNDSSILHIGSEEVHDLVIPEGTTELRGYLFAGYKALSSVSFPQSLSSIGTRTFARCSGITELLYPQSLQSIGEGAFESCKGLKSITIPEWISTVGPNAFSFCDGLKSIRIISETTKIGNRAFSACGNVETAELHRCNATGSVFDYTNIRRLIIHDYNWQTGDLGSMGSIIYTDQTKTAELSYNGKKDPRIRTMQQLVEDSAVTDDDQTLKGLTFVAAGELSIFPEGSDYYQKEYKYYRYKDWEDTGDIIEGYREVKKYPKREDLKAFVELRGGRVTSSMSGKTDFLICNSKSAKNEHIKEAARRIIPVVDEETFLRYALSNRFLTLKEEHGTMLDGQKEATKNMLPEERELISYELKLKELEHELQKVQEKKASLQAKIQKE